MCALFTCCYVRFRWDSDCVCHVLMAVVVALCPLKAPTTTAVAKEISKLPFLAPEVQWASKFTVFVRFALF